MKICAATGNAGKLLRCGVAGLLHRGGRFAALAGELLRHAGKLLLSGTDAVQRAQLLIADFAQAGEQISRGTLEALVAAAGAALPVHAAGTDKIKVGLLGCGAWLLTSLRNAEPPFSASLEELQRDREQLLP